MGTDALSAHLDRAWELLSQGDLRGARASARRALQLEGDSPEAHNLLGQVAAQEGEVDDAMEHYRTAMALDDGYVDPFLNAAELMLHPLHDFDGAIELCDEVLEFVEGGEEVVDAMLLKFDALLGKGEADDARRLLDALPEGPYEQPGQSFLVGRAFFEAGAAERAEPHLLDAMRAEPDSPDPRYYLALVCDARGDWRASTEHMLACRSLERELPAPPWALPRGAFERAVARALQGLAPELAAPLDGAIVVVDDAPGVEAVVDGVDPRAPALVEGVGDDAQPGRPGRVFVYQRNVERNCGGVEDLDDELAHTLTEEVKAATTRAITPRPPPEPRRPQPAQPARPAAPAEARDKDRERAADDDRAPRPRNKKSN
ncbi:MAG: tetratricopeptide repeat protein [Polyangiales bacterium]